MVCANSWKEPVAMFLRVKNRTAGPVKVILWTLIVYLLIGVLHGAVPAIWRHHIEDDGMRGPFQFLLFTHLFVAVLLLLAPLRGQFPPIFPHVPSAPPAGGHLRDWTLRGPPPSLRTAC